MAFFCANLEGSLTKILKISGTTNSQIFLDALFFLPKSQIIDTHFTTVWSMIEFVGRSSTPVKNLMAKTISFGNWSLLED